MIGTTQFIKGAFDKLEDKYAHKSLTQNETNKAELDKYMRKYRNKLGMDLGDWNLSYERNRAMLSMILLYYVFFNYDQQLTKKEEKSLNKILKRESIFLQKEDFAFLRKQNEKAPTKDIIKEFLEKNDYKKDMFDEAAKIIKYDIKSNYGYVRVLNDLEKYIYE